MKFNIGILMVTVALALQFGCASTPERRINKEPQLFATFDPVTQAKVRAGEIEIGFSRDMVRLALGAPRQIHARTSATGEVEIWMYTSSRYISNFQPDSTGYWYRDRAGRLYRSYDTMWVNRGWYEEFPVLSLEFVGNRLLTIERMKH